MFSVQISGIIRTTIEGDQADMDIRTVKNPIPVRNRPKDIPGLLDPFQDFPVGAAAYALGGQQSSAFACAFLNLGAGLLEPVAA